MPYTILLYVILLSGNTETTVKYYVYFVNFYNFRLKLVLIFLDLILLFFSSVTTAKTYNTVTSRESMHIVSAAKVRN